MIQQPPHWPKLLQWCGQIRDGQIQATDLKTMDAMLQRDPKARRFYVDFMLIQAALEQQEQAQTASFNSNHSGLGSLIDLAGLAELEDASLELEMVDLTDHVRAQRNQALRQQALLRDQLDSSQPQVAHDWYIYKPVFYGAIAAVVALTALLFWPNQSPTLQIIEDKLTAPQLVQVATILEHDDAQWEGASHPMQPGEPVFNEPVRLTAGFVMLRFDHGAEVIMEAPCSIEPISADEIKVTHGKLVGRCPTVKSRGFTVLATDARIVDLGTRFGVMVADSGQTEVHVFEGEVEATLHSAGDDNQPPPIYLTQGDAKRFDSARALVESVDQAPAHFKKSWDQVVRRITTTDAIRHLAAPPANVSPNALEDSSAVFLFLERAEVTLEQDLSVDAAKPGTFSLLSASPDLLAAGQTVDSYLLHFDPVMGDNPPSEVKAEGRITFNQPVVALLFSGDQLSKTDALLSASDTQYTIGEWRGLEESDSADVIRLSEDRRTIHVKWGVSPGGLDQVRVLVQSPRKRTTQ